MSRKISELPCGAKIRFGAYCVGNEGTHKVRWIKTSTNDTAFITEFIEDFRAFDAKEPQNPNDNRREYGNNRYSVSNIDQFLNSSGDTWYQKRHEHDEPPTENRIYDNTPYENHPGFLAFFDEWELDAILDTEVTVALPRCDDAEHEHEVITRKVFLPSLTNLFGRSVRNTNEGEYWEYFRNTGNTAAQPTREAIDNTTLNDNPEYGNNWYYLLRSPGAGGACGVGYVDRDGDDSYCYAFRGILGVRPALRINPEILVSDEPDDAGYYEIIQKEMEIFEVSDDEFFSLLMG